jgi:hypothetical protein
LRGFLNGAPGLALDGGLGEIGFIEDAHGHVELAVFDPGVGTDGGWQPAARILRNSRSAVTHGSVSV